MPHSLCYLQVFDAEEEFRDDIQNDPNLQCLQVDVVLGDEGRLYRPRNRGDVSRLEVILEGDGVTKLPIWYASRDQEEL